MTPVDLHMLSMPGRALWRAQAIASVENEPVTLHECSGIKHQIGTARANAYRIGCAPYCGHVDDDDILMPGAVAALVVALDARADAVGAYTDEVLITESGEPWGPGRSTGRDWDIRLHVGCPSFVHHCWIARRELVEMESDRIRGLHVGAEWALTLGLAVHGPWVHVPMEGYRWRRHLGGAHAGPPRSDLRGIYEDAARRHGLLCASPA